LLLPASSQQLHCLRLWRWLRLLASVRHLLLPSSSQQLRCLHLWRWLRLLASVHDVILHWLQLRGVLVCASGVKH
jgi:hypothetical protein